MSEEKPTEEVVESTESDVVDESVQDSETTNTENEIDYKAELELERKRAKDAEDALTLTRERAQEKSRERRLKRQEAQGEEVTDEEVDDGDAPISANQLQNILAQERQATTKKLQAQEIDLLAEQISSNDDEKALLIEVHKNRTFPSNLTLSEQIEESHLIANKKKILGRNAELTRALRGKDLTTKGAPSVHHDPPKVGEPQLSSADKKALTSSGYEWNSTSRTYDKKMPNGKILRRDSKTKKTTLI